MLYEDVLHILRASCDCIGTQEIIVIGSQAVYGTLHDSEHLPDIIITSNEVDVVSFVPTRTIEIDGTLGEGSRFHETHNRYAHGISLEDEEIPLPSDWKENLVDISFDNPHTGKTLTAWFLSLIDLCASKLSAGRSKDIVFAKWLFDNHHVSFEDVREAIEKIPNNMEKHRLGALKRLERIEKEMISIHMEI